MFTVRFSVTLATRQNLSQVPSLKKNEKGYQLLQAVPAFSRSKMLEHLVEGEGSRGGAATQREHADVSDVSATKYTSFGYRGFLLSGSLADLSEEIPQSILSLQ